MQRVWARIYGILVCLYLQCLQVCSAVNVMVARLCGFAVCPEGAYRPEYDYVKNNPLVHVTEANESFLL